jgi:hypothetical protein
MKNALLLCALGTALLGSQIAKADTFSLSFSGTFYNHTGFSNGTSGGSTDVLFTTNSTPTPGGLFNPTETPITGVTGTVMIGGVSYTIGAQDNGLDGANELADNFLGVLALNGLDFDLSTTTTGLTDTYTEMNLYYDTATAAYDYEVCTRHSGCTTDSAETTSFDITDIDPAPAATPEPSSLALLGTSILGAAGVVRRRMKL